jgi:hypothetical protein
MSIEQDSSAAVKSKVELLPWIGLWAKSWGQEPYKSARRVFWIMDNCQTVGKILFRRAKALAFLLA